MINCNIYAITGFIGAIIIGIIMYFFGIYIGYTKQIKEQKEQ